jgi:hypothetical protein
MSNYMLYPRKYRKHNHNAPVFKSIRRIKKKCENCGRLPVGIINGQVLCSKCCDDLRYKNKLNWKKVKRA